MYEVVYFFFKKNSFAKYKINANIISHTIMFMSFANWQYVDLLSASHWTDVPTRPKTPEPPIPPLEPPPPFAILLETHIKKWTYKKV